MPKNNDDNKYRRELLQSLSIVSQIGFTIVACIIAGVFFGRFLDNLLGTSPWLLIVFSLFGMGAAFRSMFDFAKRK